MGRQRKRNTRWDDIDGGMAFSIPITLLRHENFARLSAYGNKIVMDLARQFSGFNNGFLCASWSLMKDRGWRSSHTVQKALREVEHYNIVVCTQHGGRNRPSLYALTWRRIDEKKGQELELRPTIKPTDSWKDVRPAFVQETRRTKTKPPIRRAA